MLVSIIIPVYNVAPYVEQCLRSVMNQTMTEGVECILVDDCGQDDSMEVVNRMISEYEGKIEFRIFHHDRNRGLSAARNTGIDAAKGDWIYFLDSDDWIYKDCIENLCATAIRYPEADFIQGLIKAENGCLNGWTQGSHNIPPVECLDDSYRCRLLLQQTNHLPFMQNRLIKVSFIKQNDLYAKEGMVHEDNFWTFFAGKCVQCIAFCKVNTYFYRNSSTGIVSSAAKQVRAKGCSILCDEIMKNISLDKWFNTELNYVLWRLQTVVKLGYEDPFVFTKVANHKIIKKLYELKNSKLHSTLIGKVRDTIYFDFLKFLLYVSLLLKEKSDNS